MKQNTTSQFMVLSALIAAAYVALTYISLAFGLAFGEIQFRLSEALNIIAAFTPAAIPGLTIGCFISNLASPYPLDLLFGTLATLLSAVTIRLIAKVSNKLTPYLSVFPPAIFNAVLIGAQITLFTPDSASLLAFTLTAVSVFIGEFAVCSLLGVPLYYVLQKNIGKLSR